jgi:hypothetical protein
VILVMGPPVHEGHRASAMGIAAGEDILTVTLRRPYAHLTELVQTAIADLLPKRNGTQPGRCGLDVHDP